jgi:hypothetical protein
MPKFNRTAVTIEAIELQYPMTMTTPNGVVKADKGDYLVSGNKDQFFMKKALFEMSYQVSAEPDTIAPTEITNLTLSAVTDTTATFAFTTPPDADFKLVNIYQNGVLLTPFDLTGDVTYTTAPTLTASTAYTFLFTTVDNAGNESTGITLNVTTAAAAI